MCSLCNKSCGRGSHLRLSRYSICDKPLTTVFFAGSLVHHRYRTEERHPRSCVIVAFHRASDNRGEYLEERGAEYIESELHRHLLGSPDITAGSSFIAALISHGREIGEKLRALREGNSESIVVEQRGIRLSPSEAVAWKTVVLQAPTVEEIKAREVCLQLQKAFSPNEFMDLIATSMMFYDKHGPLDLILYDDGHEEIRKWARNRIPEMKPDQLRRRLDSWVGEVRQPELRDALEVNELVDIANRLAYFIGDSAAEKLPSPRVEERELIAPHLATRSVVQLVKDLAESLIRSYSIQNYLSTSLFLFWSCDELWRIFGCELDDVRRWGATLLRNYVATALLAHRCNTWQGRTDVQKPSARQNP